MHTAVMKPRGTDMTVRWSDAADCCEVFFDTQGGQYDQYGAKYVTLTSGGIVPEGQARQLLSSPKAAWRAFAQAFACYLGGASEINMRREPELIEANGLFFVNSRLTAY